MQNSSNYSGLMMPGFGGISADAFLLQSHLLNGLSGVNLGQNSGKENKQTSPMAFTFQPIDPSYAALAAQLNFNAQNYGFIPLQTLGALQNQGNLDLSKGVLSGLQFGFAPSVAPIVKDSDNLAKGKKRSSAQSMKTEKQANKAGGNGEVTKTTKKRRRVTVKLCHVEGCSKLARSTTLYCAAHGGGRRCLTPGCLKAARGATNFCIAHGGGRRCRHPNCTKSAQGSTHFCIAHGGGRRCRNPDCTKSARGPAGYCKAHGGGKKCEHPSCSKSAAENSSFCRPHGGGMKCSVDECPRAVKRNQDYCAEHDDAQKEFQGTAQVVPLSSINNRDIDLKEIKNEKKERTPVQQAL